VAIGVQPVAGGRVESSWKLGATDGPSFEELYTAALRSIGIAARLGRQGKTELWTGVEWRPAPRPLVESGFEFHHPQDGKG
jgi:hypothetical protein